MEVPIPELKEVAFYSLMWDLVDDLVKVVLNEGSHVRFLFPYVGFEVPFETDLMEIECFKTFYSLMWDLRSWVMDTGTKYGIGLGSTS